MGVKTREADPKPMCGRCYEEVDKLYPANCDEKPEHLKGQPIGQYHCPDCGAMVLAGLPHPELCKRCVERKHPGFDKRKVLFVCVSGAVLNTNREIVELSPEKGWKEFGLGDEITISGDIEQCFGKSVSEATVLKVLGLIKAD